MSNILITGGELFNKGAQAMTFTVINEIHSRAKNKNIILCSGRDFNRDSSVKKQYTFDFTDLNLYSISRLCGGLLKCAALLKYFLSNKSNSAMNLEIGRSKSILENTECIIDISGYALSSQWGVKSSIAYLLKIYLAKKFNIPIYILPQSFGPFFYKARYRFILDLMIKKIMSYPEVIYAREKEGYNLLTKKYKLKNVKLSQDIVLVNKDIRLNNIYTNVPDMKNIDIATNSVCILPNMRNFDHGNRRLILKLYRRLVKLLLKMDKNVYLLRHSYEDIEACILIKEMFKENENVILLSDEFSCIEYEAIVCKFNYLIASRFHSIVHAYKHGIPCVVLGWATKYHELLATFKQSQYIFDVRGTIDQECVLKAVKKIDAQFEKESQTILNVLKDLQQLDIFGFLDEKRD